MVAYRDLKLRLLRLDADVDSSKRSVSKSAATLIPSQPVRKFLLEGRRYVKAKFVAAIHRRDIKYIGWGNTPMKRKLRVVSMVSQNMKLQAPLYFLWFSVNCEFI
jgi:hypothetical protein